MDTSGIGELIYFILNGLVVLTGTILLYKVFTSTGNRKSGFGFLLILLIVVYGVWWKIGNNFKAKADTEHIGTYQLIRFPSCSDCILELQADNRYEVRNTNRTFETGTWSYFDNGDIAYIQLSSGGYLGLNEYEYRERQGPAHL
ncbi:MAG: hypothetical protein K0S09_88 [Sphingobacteriaceae bacterium]|jgi:hypothetical protein|nr:hypothetical protein [Sphingobacteriaceae bacterium]